MRNYYENKLGMYNGVITLLNKPENTESLSPAAIEAKNDLENKVTEINDKENEKSSATSGKTRAKKLAANRLIEQVMVVSGALLAWSVDNDNPEVQAISNLTRSYLKKIRDNELDLKGKQIYNLAQQHIDNSSNYGINAESLTELQQLSDTYHMALGEQESSMANRVSAGASMATLFQEADEILKLRLDSLMETVKPNNQDLYDAYNAARVIKDLRGSGTRRQTAPVQEEEIVV